MRQSDSKDILRCGEMLSPLAHFRKEKRIFSFGEKRTSGRYPEYSFKEHFGLWCWEEGGEGQESFPIFIRHLRTRHERRIGNRRSATSPCFLFWCSSLGPRLSPTLVSAGTTDRQKGLRVYFETSMGEVTCGETVLGRHLGARVGHLLLLVPLCRQKKKDSEKSLAQGHLAGKW